MAVLLSWGCSRKDGTQPRAAARTNSAVESSAVQETNMANRTEPTVPGYAGSYGRFTGYLWYRLDLNPDGTYAFTNVSHRPNDEGNFSQGFWVNSNGLSVSATNELRVFDLHIDPETNHPETLVVSWKTLTTKVTTSLTRATNERLFIRPPFGQGQSSAGGSPDQNVRRR